MFSPNVQVQNAGGMNFLPTDETTKVSFNDCSYTPGDDVGKNITIDDKGEAGKVITIPPLDRAESEGFVKYYPRMGWRCGLCVGQMNANGVAGRIECKRCGTSAYFKEMSHKQRKCRLEKSKEVNVYPRPDGNFHARTQGKDTAYTVFFDSRCGRWECACQDFRHHSKYQAFKCKHVLAVERHVKTPEKPVVKHLDAISRLERRFDCKVTGILEAVSVNGRSEGEAKREGQALSPTSGTYSVKLSSLQNSGIESEIRTTLDVDALKSLGWEPPKKSRSFDLLESTLKEPDELAYPDYNRNWFYANLKALARKGVLIKHGLDTDLVKVYVCRRFGIVGLTQLDDRQWALIAAEVNAMNDDAEICEERCAEIKKFLVDGAEKGSIDLSGKTHRSGSGSLKVIPHKREQESNTERLGKNSCSGCGAECEGKFCSVCVDKMLGNKLEKKGYHRTDGTTTTKANIRNPVEADKKETLIIHRNARGKYSICEDDNGFPGDVIVVDECVLLNDFKDSMAAQAYAKKRFPEMRVMTLHSI